MNPTYREYIQAKNVVKAFDDHCKAVKDARLNNTLLFRSYNSTSMEDRFLLLIEHHKLMLVKKQDEYERSEHSWDQFDTFKEMLLDNINDARVNLFNARKTLRFIRTKTK